MKIVLSHPTSNANVRAIAKGLSDTQLLHTFYTAVAVFSGTALDKLSQITVFSELKRRKFNDPYKDHTKSWPWWEIGRIISSKINKFNNSESGIFSVYSTYLHFDNYVAKRLKKTQSIEVAGVYAYEDGAFETFKSAKILNIKCIYDLPIAYWEIGRKLMFEEAARMPEWSITLGGGISDSPSKLERKEQELRLADIVIVPSKFVMDSLPAWVDKSKVVMAPFGSPMQKVTNTISIKNNFERPLRVLFAGSMGQRKGLGDLFAAVKLLNNSNIELVVMGTLLAPIDFYRQQLPDFTYEPGRPHEDVLALMRSCDVFCLPSIVEGRALVMQEAMSQGLPLIITPNTGGEDLIVDGVTGFLVPIRSPESIAKKINWFLENRSKIPEMGKMAQQHAQQYTWDNYGKKIIESIQNLLST